MTLNYYNFISIHKNCVFVFFLYSLKLSAVFVRHFWSELRGKWNLWLRTHAAVNTIQTILVGTGHCRIPFHLTSSLLKPTHPSSPICLSHTPWLLFWAGLRQRLWAKTCLHLLKHMTNTHTEAGKGWVGHSRCGTLPKAMHRHTHRHKHVETGPLAMEIFRGRSEFRKGKSIFQPELPYVNWTFKNNPVAKQIMHTCRAVLKRKK